MTDEDGEPDPVKIGFEIGEEGNFYITIGPNWQRIVDEYYSNFEAIRKTYMTDPETVVGKYEEIDGPEEHDPEKFLVENPPEQLLENPDWQEAIFDTIYSMLAQQGMGRILIEELRAIEDLIGENSIKPAIMRESAFFENHLVIMCQLSLQRIRGGVLSNTEFGLINQMGHTDRTRLAHLLGAIDEEEHGYLQRLINCRNKIAHTTWSDFDEDDEQEFGEVARKVMQLMQEYEKDAKARGEKTPYIDLDKMIEGE